MTTKKKTTRTKRRSRKKTPEIETDDLGNKYLSQLDLKTLELADYKWRCVKQERALKEHERVEVVGRIDRRIRELAGAESKLLGSLRKIRQTLGERYGVSFDDPGLSYDDETGRLIVVDRPEKK